ncbi:flagellar biosynthetic protein FliR [Rickettsiales bacterium]|nr:flagellar biosynthetic protein FliR [Rickettsiales bacterium]
MESLLAEITTETIFAFFLIFCRIGAAIMLLPSIGETFISPRSRLIIALGLSLIILPVIKKMLPAIPASMITMFIYIFSEILIGVFFGVIARLVMSALHVAGMIISYQMGLAAANMFDPTQGGQSSAIGTFMSFLAILLIFTSGTHYLFLQGILDSYEIFIPNSSLPVEGFSNIVVQVAAESFMVGFKMSSPIIVMGLILYLGAGVMGRLMPQMQVFFVLIPMQIILGIFILLTVLSATMMWFMDYYQETMSNFLAF